MRARFPLIKTGVLGLLLSSASLHAAEPFDPTSQPLGHIGPIELTETDLETGGRAFRGWFENGAWQGDLVEYTVSGEGAMTTSIDLSGISPQQTGSENWSAHVEFAGQNENYWDNRKIILGDGDSHVPFRWYALTNEQKNQIDSAAPAEGPSIILDFLRGQRSNEYPSGPLRQRYSILGDIIHSNPEYVARPNGNSSETSYTDFVNARANRIPAVYVGSNNGMLHAFNANNGSELWAYVPSMLVHKLSRLAGRPYIHNYYVDGGITVRDAYFDDNWRTVLAGSLGSGGKGMFLLDVTTPALQSESSNSGENKKVLWEIDENNTAVGDDIGFIFGQTTIAKMNDGRWYAINGNGVSSTNGKAMLILVDIESGLIKKISTETGDEDSPNGLAAPALVDTNNDGTADIAYAGDIDGDMWRFDLSGASPASWSVDYLLYDGLASQPITTAPDVASHPEIGYLVLFGTGRLYTADDIGDTSTQAVFGIHDDGSTPDLNNRAIRVLSEDTVYNEDEFDELVRTFDTAGSIDWSEYDGWQVNLLNGERMLTTPILRAGRLKSTITNPNGYSNWLLETKYNSGAYADGAIYDLDRNGVLDQNDMVDNSGNEELGDPEDIPMAWRREDGTMSQVTIARLERGFDTLFLNYLNPPLVAPPCVGNCEGGIEGGHFDVDTDTRYEGSTDEHEHEYDDTTDLTYIDYFSPEEDLDSIEDGVTDPNQEFIVLIANADLSPGATLVLGNNRYNVVEYQEMIHRKIANWPGNGNGALKDDNNQSLIHSLNTLQADGGTLRISFNSTSITSGGLHPTQTSCVKNQLTITSGRWRNGALTMHVVDRDHFKKAGGSSLKPIDKVKVQTPDDLLERVVMSDGSSVILKDGSGKNYGGLIAQSATEFLFETTVFWHFKGKCYGDPEWIDDVKDAIGYFSEELFLALLAAYDVESFDDLAATLASLESCKDESEEDGGCEEEYELLSALLAVYPHVSGGVAGGVSEGPPTGFENYSGEPAVIQGGVVESGRTKGPNFRIGRRGWTDIVPRNQY